MTREKPNPKSRDAKVAGPNQCPGVISTLEIYTIEEARRRLRWSQSAFRAAKRRGLSLLASGKRRYVTGQEILRFLSEPRPSAEPQA